MISRTAEYALRAIVCLADKKGTPLTTQQIAETTRVPAGYLSKVLQALGRAGLVVSQRGLHGGFTLGVSPAALSVLDVINAVDPIQRIRQCPLGLKSHGEQLCPLHRRLDNAMEMVERAFGQSTVAELLAEPNRSRPLCEATVEGQTTEPSVVP
ncbi:MAG: Rrf2 family transcriptional regulator [Planctomycetes bacterium]|nr:Rrf2 family transcriptional regulator [Planctomycetota bacterium]